ncbi:MAG TPA: response regulator [Acetobacteraceae bacterium]|nr:response regulator [Acetobacteraceae bacterium]
MSDRPGQATTILVAESDVLVRLAIAAYLRDCGYRVIEAASSEEARAVLASEEADVAVVLSAVDLAGAMDGFALAQWVRKERSGVAVILAGTVEREARQARELCEEGPHLRKPYEPQQVVAWISRLRNTKREA